MTAEAEFQFPGRLIPGTDKPAAQSRFQNINLILGDNGSGKSTILKAIALAVLGTVLPDSGFRPYSLVRKDADRSEIVANIETTAVDSGTPGSGRFHTVLQRYGKENSLIQPDCGLSFNGESFFLPPSLRDPDSPAFFLCGYGATRRAEDSAVYDEAARNKQRSARYQRVAGLFEEHFSLTSFSRWLVAFHTSKRHSAQLFKIFERLLECVDLKWTRRVEDGEAIFEMPDGLAVPFDALSDGYRAFLAWIGDLLRHLCSVTAAKVAG